MYLIFIFFFCKYFNFIAIYLYKLYFNYKQEVEKIYKQYIKIIQRYG